MLTGGIIVLKTFMCYCKLVIHEHNCWLEWCWFETTVTMAWFTPHTIGMCFTILTPTVAQSKKVRHLINGPARFYKTDTQIVVDSLPLEKVLLLHVASLIFLGRLFLYLSGLLFCLLHRHLLRTVRKPRDKYIIWISQMCALTIMNPNPKMYSEPEKADVNE